jgi:hypothetical protein
MFNLVLNLKTKRIPSFLKFSFGCHYKYTKFYLPMTDTAKVAIPTEKLQGLFLKKMFNIFT